MHSKHIMTVNFVARAGAGSEIATSLSLLLLRFLFCRNLYNFCVYTLQTSSFSTRSVLAMRCEQVRTSINLRRHLFEFRECVCASVCHVRCSRFTPNFPYECFSVSICLPFFPRTMFSAPVFIVRPFMRLYALVYCFCQHRISTPKIESS